MKVFVDTENNEIAVEASPSEAVDFIQGLFCHEGEDRFADEEWFKEYLLHNPIDYH